MCHGYTVDVEELSFDNDEFYNLPSVSVSRPVMSAQPVIDFANRYMNKNDYSIR